MTPGDARVLGETMRSDGLIYRALRLSEEICKLRHEARGAGLHERWFIEGEIAALKALADKYQAAARVANLRAFDG